jgi:WD40 repeat protein
MIKAFSEAGGGYFENVKIEPRLITLTFHAKLAVSGQRLAFSGPPAAEEEPVSLGYLHQLRQTLIDLVKPDLTGGNEDIWFKYQDGSLPLYFQGRYDGGLTGEWDIRNQFINSFPLRLLCMDPMVREDNQEVAALDFQNNQNAGNFNRVAGRINGEWSVMNYGMDGTVGDLELGSKGEIFAAGSFNDVNHKASAIAPFVVARFVAYWDGTRWYAFGNGAAAGTSVNDMAIAPNGDVYVTGLFSSIGGVAANNIAKWNGTTWSALGTGLDFPGLNIAISPNGIVYVGGQFTIAGGVAAFYIAKWDGATWRALGQFNGLDSYVQAIAITPDGKTLYIGGQFDDQNTAPGSGLHRICLYDVDTDRFSAMGAGVNANVLEVILSPANILYIGGDFFLSGATTINRIGAWVGNAWVPLGIGMDDIVYSMDIGPNGDILAVGAFLRAGGVEARHLALWNGSTWTNLDIEFSIGNTALILLAVQYNSNGDIFVGGQALPDTPTLYAKINTIDNQGSAESFPVVYVAGPGQLRWLENQTNQKRIFFDLFVFSGEEVIIDFAKGTVESTVRGSLLDSVLPGSDFQEFTLLPGLNKLAVFMLNDVNAQMQIAWTPRHWGVDVGAGSN